MSRKNISDDDMTVNYCISILFICIYGLFVLLYFILYKTKRWKCEHYLNEMITSINLMGKEG